MTVLGTKAVAVLATAAVREEGSAGVGWREAPTEAVAAAEVLKAAEAPTAEAVMVAKGQPAGC